MTDVIKDATVRVTITDDTQQGAAKVKQSTDKLSQNIKQNMNKSAQSMGMFGEKAGRSLSQFNEKTERGRQVMNMFGATVGGQAGYISGTLGYIVGRFSALELVTFGLVAALGAYANTLFDVKRAQNAAAEAVKKHRKELAELQKDTKRLELQAKGFSAAEAEYIIKQRGEMDAYQAMAKAKYQATKAQAELDRMIALERESMGTSAFEEAARKAALAKARVEELSAAYEVAAEKSKQAGLQKEIGDNKTGMRDALKTDWDKEQEKIDKAKDLALLADDKRYQLELDAAQRQADALLAIENDKTRAQMAWREWYFNQQQQLQEQLQDSQIAGIERQIELEKERYRVAANIAGIMGDIASKIFKSEEAQMRAKALFRSIEYGIEAAGEAAAIPKAIANQDYFAAAQHAAAMTLYGVAAAQAGAYAMAGGGGGGGGASVSSSTGGFRDLEKPDSENKGSVININIEGNVLSGRNAGEKLADMLDAFNRSRHPGRPRTEVE